MYCSNCGKKLDDSSQYCTHCGIKIVVDTNTNKSNNFSIGTDMSGKRNNNAATNIKTVPHDKNSSYWVGENVDINKATGHKPDDNVTTDKKNYINESLTSKIKAVCTRNKRLTFVIIAILALILIRAAFSSNARNQKQTDSLSVMSQVFASTQTTAENTTGEVSATKETSKTSTTETMTETTTETTTEATVPPTTKKSLGKGKIELTNDSFYGDHKEVISELKEMGFTNVTKKAIYDCDSGWWDSVDIGRTEKVVIAGNEDYDVGDVFNKKDKVVVYYHEYIYDDPDIEYHSVTVKKLDDDMEKNAITAEEKYKGKYFAVTGYVDEIDSKSITLTPDSSGWSLYVVRAEIKTDEQLTEAKKLSVGNMITLKGKITEARSSIGSSYSMDIYQIVL